MTIKEFAQLVGCNPQTLRYYDHVELLRPASVDERSGYRFYDEAQALAFVRIKHLQRAGFSIAEIKRLMAEDDAAIYGAFDAKIAEAQRRLDEIKSIQRLYRSELRDMKGRLQAVRDSVRRSMANYDPAEEFGIGADEYGRIVAGVDGFFEGEMARCDVSGGGLAGRYAALKEGAAAGLLRSSDWELIYEKHSWRFVRDFFDEFACLEGGREYALVFELAPDKDDTTAFANTMLGMLMRMDAEKSMQLTCHVYSSPDGHNHFWLLRRGRERLKGRSDVH